MPSIASKGAKAELALASLAVLTVNWHANAKSYLDSFVPFAIEGIRATGRTETSDAQACEAVREKFALAIPSEVMGGILRRAIRQGLGSRLNGGVFRLSDTVGITTSSLDADLARLVREQGDLERSLTKFAKERFGLDWSQEESSKALLAYVEDASARMVVASYQGATPADDFTSSEPERITVAAFIQDIWAGQPERFDYLLNVAKGSFLATTMFFQNHFDQDRKFRNTTLYLDTGVILGALGYEGPERQAAALEWIRLAQTQGARIATFDVTVREARGVLQGALGSIKANRGWEGRPGSVLAHFNQQGLSVGVITAEISTIEAKLQRLRVEVHGLPDQNSRRQLQIDEAEVERSLNEGLYPYANENALHHDSRVLGAMLMLRNGSAQDRFEESRAVFITGNFRVVRAARKTPDLQREPWPVAMHVNDAAVLLWIKVGTDGSDLPRKQLLASCLVILRPSEPTWSKYVIEIKALEAQGSIEDVDIALIAQQNERDGSALINSIGSDGRVEIKSPRAVLAEARDAVAQPLRAQMKAVAEEAGNKVTRLTREMDELSADNQIARAELEALKSARLARQKRTARRVAVSLSVVVAVAITALIGGCVSLFKLDLGILLGAISLAAQLVVVLFPFRGRSLLESIEARLLKSLQKPENLA